MPEMNVPSSFDRQTAEYCAAVCDHVAAVLLVRVGKHAEAVAAGACARAIRAAITLARPLPPATIRDLVSCETAVAGSMPAAALCHAPASS